MTTETLPLRRTEAASGSLQIGDQWNAINIIAMSQTHPLKAVCELVENAIDAKADSIRIVRRRHEGQVFLEVTDNGRGVRPDEDGHPNFAHIATHICDSMKRHLSRQDRAGIHGEFGIGLLSFWSLGDEMRMTSGNARGQLFQMVLRRGERDYEIRSVRGEFDTGGTRVEIGPLLDSTRNIVTGEKLQRYLSAELRDRIRSSGVVIEISDRLSRKEVVVKPREFIGEKLSEIGDVPTPFGKVVVDLYLRTTSDGEATKVALCKDGTRVLEDLSELVYFEKAPWTGGRLEGVIDYSALNLAPGTRRGVVPDEQLEAFVKAVDSLEFEVKQAIERREQAASARANKQILKQVQKAFVGALRELEDQYLYFDVPANARKRKKRKHADPRQKTLVPDVDEEGPSVTATRPGQLDTVLITPRHARREPKAECILIAKAFDAHDPIEDRVEYVWRVVEGDGRIVSVDGARCCLTSPQPGRVVVEVTATKGIREAKDRVPVKFMEDADEDLGSLKGLPTYRMQAARGQAWRSRYNVRTNEIVINSTHRDFVASQSNAAKHRRYIGKLYAKEVVLLNFPHESSAEAMERLIEVIVRTEDAL